MKGSITIDRERCKGCSLCIEFCPNHCISLSTYLNLKGYFTSVFNDGAECSACASCAIICPEVAIEVDKN